MSSNPNTRKLDGFFFAFLYKVVFMFEKKAGDEPSEAGYGIIF